MDDLRVILLILGAVALAAVYFLSTPRKPRQARERQLPAESAAERESGLETDALRVHAFEDEPEQKTLSLELERLGELISRDHDEEHTGTVKSRKAKTKAGDQAAAPKPIPERIVAIYVRTLGAEQINGKQIQTGVKKVGLEYGHMDIYHRLDEAGTREAIFSLANMTPPGTLDQAQSPDFTTPGVALFLQLPGPVSGLDALDAMLAAARRLSELWGAEALDDNHSALTRQRIQQLREEMRDYDRRQMLEVHKSTSQ